MMENAPPPFVAAGSHASWVRVGRLRSASLFVVFLSQDDLLFFFFSPFLTVRRFQANLTSIPVLLKRKQRQLISSSPANV